MMKSRLVTLSLLGWFSLSAMAENGDAPVAPPALPAPAAAAAAKPIPPQSPKTNFYRRIECKTSFDMLMDQAEQAVIASGARQSDYRPPLWVTKKFRNYRDRLTEFFQWAHGHHFPKTATEDESAIEAWALAKEAFGNLSAAQKERLPGEIKIEDIAEKVLRGSEETPGLLPYVKSYPERLKLELDRIASMGSRLDSLKKAFRESRRGQRHNLQVEVVDMNFNEQGKLVASKRWEEFPNRAAIGLEISAIRSEIKAGNFMKRHVEAMENLENIMQQIRREKSLQENAGKELSGDYKEIYEGILSLYKPVDGPVGEPAVGDGINLLDQYRLPLSAWEHVRKQQFYGEIKSIWTKDLPRLKDSELTQEWLNFVKDLTPEEKRAMGFGKIASSPGLLGRTKIVKVIGGLGSLFTGLGVGSVQLFKAVIGDRVEKENCAAEEDDALFSDCVVVYLEGKFPGKNVRELMDVRPAILDTALNIVDEKVKAEVADVIRRRVAYQQEMREQADAKEMKKMSINKMLAETDPTSPAYRQRLVRALDEDQFKLLVFGDSKLGLVNVLEKNFPSTYHVDSYRKIAERIFAEELESDKQQYLVQLLFDERAVEMSNWIQDLLRDRATFVSDQDANAEFEEEEEMDTAGEEDPVPDSDLP